MVRAGVPERAAMMISCHKIRSVFEWNNIINEDDLRKASERVKGHHEEMAALQNGHNLGTVQVQEADIYIEDRPQFIDGQGFRG